MLVVLNIFASFVQLAISVTMFAMVARMLLPLFVNPEESRLYLFAALISEPVVAPVRALLYAFGVGDRSPLDFSVPTAYLVLMIIQWFLPAIPTVV